MSVTASAVPAIVRLALVALSATAAAQAASAQAESAPAASAPAASAPGAAPATSAPQAAGAEVQGEPIVLRSSSTLQPPLRGDAARRSPIILRARTISGTPESNAEAEGAVEFRRAGTVIRADELHYEQADDLATAKGNVRISRDGNIYTGPELQLKVERFEGFFEKPTYYFSRTGAGGTAQRIDFLGDQRAVATGATYSSCRADGSEGPAWILETDRVNLDFANNEGVAEGGVLRFYGVPILAAPRLSFPLTEERKSGWLPPSFGIDSKNGVQVSAPFYWNIAPNRDATFTPGFSLRRGASLGTEFRYLEPNYSGRINLDLLPHDNLTGNERYALNALHDGDLGNDARLQFRLLRVSDDNYWKDFAREVPSLTPRLLASDLMLSRPFGAWDTYARVQAWQVLQTDDPTTRIEAPYERAPQLGARYAGPIGAGFEVGFEGEFNRFISPNNASLTPRVNGNRVHALASLARPYTTPGFSLIPKVAFNAATYAVEQPLGGGSPSANVSANASPIGTTNQSATRVIPTLSLDAAWVFERDASFFGRAVRQTLEPRLQYVNTPYRDQSGLPNFDSFAKDFNFDSIFTENAFTGVDRVSDANQVTAGVTTRVIDPTTGAEALRLGVAQRYLLRDERVTPDGQPLTQRVSDLLFVGSTTVIPAWMLEGSVQYSPETDRVNRSIISVRYSPGPYRTLSAAYRLTRGLSEQVELGWQWPIYGPTPNESSSASRRSEGGSGSSCRGTLYGVGRINYSTFEKRLTDAVVGVEYDAGCWIGRIVASRLSTGRSEATTRLLLQLELVGLSKLGINPLQVLKDNIPGYRLLRDDRSNVPFSSIYD